jgi:hypothetical protein
MRLDQRIPSAVMAAIALLSVAGAPAGAQEPPPTHADARLVLFDGKRLAGWKKTEFYGAEAVKISVENGVIVMEVGKPMTGITTTRTDLPRVDYELTYEAQRLRGNDFFAAATFPVGRSYITFVNGGWGGNVTGLSSLGGADASENETTAYVKYENGRWYRFRVWVTDQVIRCWIDDKPIVDVDHSEHEVRTRIETRRNEPLGFATYDSAGALRKIEMRRLTPEEIASVRKGKD